MQVSRRVGIARGTSLPQSTGDGGVGGRRGAERQQIGRQQDEKRVARVPRVDARLRPRLLAHRHPHSLRHLHTPRSTYSLHDCADNRIEILVYNHSLIASRRSAAASSTKASRGPDGKHDSRPSVQ